MRAATTMAAATTTTYVALLRAVNLAGHQPVAMADLRAWLGALGFDDARSLLQSGNLVFRGKGAGAAAAGGVRGARGASARAKLEQMLEAESARRLDLPTDFFVRTADEWDALVACNPYPKQAKADPSHLLVVFLKAPPPPGAVEALQAAITGRETVRAEGAQAYVVYPDGIGRSRVTMALIEKKLGARGTGRNWNTVLKLGALART